MSRTRQCIAESCVMLRNSINSRSNKKSSSSLMSSVETNCVGWLSACRLLTAAWLLGIASVAQSAQPPPPGAPPVAPAKGEDSSNDILLSSPTLNLGVPLLGPGGELLSAPSGPEAHERATWSRPADRSRKIGPVSILQVRPDIEMLTINGLNVAVQSGPDGTLVIGVLSDTRQAPQSCTALIAAIKQVAVEPIRYIINTSADPGRVGCNAALAKAGYAFSPGVRGFAALVMSHQNALLRLISQPEPRLDATAYPSETFSGKARSFYINGQGVQLIWMPGAHTDGDITVLFRRSDVVVTGEIFDPTRFPHIDLERGGSIQKELMALNEMVNFQVIPSVPKWQRAGGTLIIPARGPLSSHLDLVNYRDMLTIIRDRIQSLIDGGSTLAEIKAADVTRGYAARYGSNSGEWTTNDFVEALYKNLIAGKPTDKP